MSAIHMRLGQKWPVLVLRDRRPTRKCCRNVVQTTRCEPCEEEWTPYLSRIILRVTEVSDNASLA